MAAFADLLELVQSGRDVTENEPFNRRRQGRKHLSMKTAIITGASRGLGAATARILGESKMNVVLNARSETELRAVAQEIDPHGQRVLVVPGDVSRLEDCRRVVDQTIERFGRLDALINNAGLLRPVASIADSDPDAWRTNLEVNLLGPFYLTHLALPHLRESRGHIVNVSSGAAVRPEQGWSAYCTAKAGINHFTRVLAEEEEQVVAITFRPGVVDTEMQRTIREEGDAGMPAENHRRFVEYHEEGELLAPEIPGRAMAVLALAAPPEWSGEFIRWDEARVQALVVEHF